MLNLSVDEDIIQSFDGESMIFIIFVINFIDNKLKNFFK